MSLDNRPFTRVVSCGRAFTAMLVLLSAALAALAAHIGIDELGDVLLAHDIYDTIAHGSRTIMSGTLVAALAVALLVLLRSAVKRRRAARQGSDAGLPAATGPRDTATFLVLVAATAVGLLIAMEAGDVLLAGQSIGDLDDLLGGSIWLGLSVTIPTALGSAFAVRQAARWATTAEIAALRILDALLESRPRTSRCIRLSQRAGRRQPVHVMALSRNASRRGPPHPSA
jgi:hypothetical protein